MKFGLLYFKDTDNIGDDIQSYAAYKFLPRIDYMIDRENIISFIPDKKEYVYTIMNAWYVHDRLNLGFSPYIYPKLVSMHFNRYDIEGGSLTNIGIDYINEYVREYLKKYSPVGVRDYHTQKIFDELNIDNYFSGCLTLTLPKFQGLKKEDYICAVNLSDEELEKLKSITKREIKIINQDIPMGSLSDKTWEERAKNVEELLKIYQKAHMVITTKLHCALPCLALETPVLLLYDKKNQDRIGTFREFVNYMDREEFMASTINVEKPSKNPDKYLKYRKKLIKDCSDFVKNPPNANINDLPDIKTYKETIRINKIYNDVIITHYNKLIDKYKHDFNDWYGRNMELEAEVKTRDRKLKEEVKLTALQYENSKSWKITKPLRKITSIINKKK